MNQSNNKNQTNAESALKEETTNIVNRNTFSILHNGPENNRSEYISLHPEDSRPYRYLEKHKLPPLENMKEVQLLLNPFITMLRNIAHSSNMELHDMILVTEINDYINAICPRLKEKYRSYSQEIDNTMSTSKQMYRLITNLYNKVQKFNRFNEDKQNKCNPISI